MPTSRNWVGSISNGAISSTGCSTLRAPHLRQNTADFELDYGLLWQGLELSLESPVIAIVSAQRHGECRTVAGSGDTNVGLKYEFVEEQPDDPWPALAASSTSSFPQEIPDRAWDPAWSICTRARSCRRPSRTSLSSEPTLASSSLATRPPAHSACEQEASWSPQVHSLVRDCTARLKLGLETFAAVSDKFAVRRGLLQLQAGGNYELVQGFSLDFGIVRGFYGASPRVALQLAFFA
jgi:hypothetical protein